MCFVFQGVLFWNREAPVSFQSFHNLKYGSSRWDVFDCFHVYCYDPKGSKQCYERCSHLSKIKADILYKIQPVFTQFQLCTLLLVSNLVQPEWISINCAEQVLKEVVCVSNEAHFVENIYLEGPPDVCGVGFVRFHGKCYCFAWNKSSECGQKTKIKNKSKLMSLNNITNLTVVMQEAITAHLPPVLLHKHPDGNNWQSLFVKKYLNIVQYKLSTNETSKTTGGYFAFEMDSSASFVPGNLFSCENGGFILRSCICDGKFDCVSDKSDEDGCQCNSTKMLIEKGQSFCKHVKHSNQTICGSLFHKSHKGICQTYVGTLKLTIMEDENLFACPLGANISINMVNDMYSDCEQEFDEPYLLSFLINHTHQPCQDPNFLPCKPGLPRCFQTNESCFYRLNEIGRLIPCSNGGNLEQCEKFDCNFNVKCPSSYCIPWSYILDGKWDCENGKDEDHEGLYKNRQNMCRNMFQCESFVGSCLPLSNICDGIEDCPRGDDETFCDVKHRNCLKTCLCLGYAIKCFKYCVSLTVLKNPSFTTVIFIEFNLRTIQRAMHRIFPKAKYLRYVNVSLQTICDCCLPEGLKIFTSLFNNLQLLTSFCFQSVVQVVILRLDRNNISAIQEHSFSGLDNLVVLTLSQNPLVSIRQDTFSKMTNGSIHLFLWGVNLEQTDSSVFISIKLSGLYTQDYHLCCLVDQTVCAVEIPWNFSCDDLLPEKSMLFLFVGFSCLVTFLSSVSMVLHVGRKHFSKAFRINVVSLNIIDMLLVSYLATIWIASVLYKGVFSVFEKTWRSGVPCFACSTVMIVFKICTELVLIHLSISRLVAVVYPFESKLTKSTKIMKHIFCLALISVGFGVSYTVLLSIIDGNLPTTICLPLVDPFKTSVLVVTLSWLIVFSELAALSTCTILHVLLVRKYSDSQQKIQSNVSKQKSSRSLKIQLMLVTLSNAACWLPANTFFISTMFLERYPIKMIIWVTIGILPINSCVHSCVLIIFCLKSKYTSSSTGLVPV